MKQSEPSKASRLAWGSGHFMATLASSVILTHPTAIIRTSHLNALVVSFAEERDLRKGSSKSRCTETLHLVLGPWPDITIEVADVHIRSDANNLVTTALTTHFPEQRETMHLIQILMLRKDSNSRQTHDLEHVRSEDCLADSLTEHSAKADELIKGNLLNVDDNPNVGPCYRTRRFGLDGSHAIQHMVGIAEHMFPSANNL